MTLTTERRERAFNEGLTFRDFVQSMQVNQDLFLANYSAYQLSEAEKAFFAELPEVVDVLVLAHDWCGDVVANTPLFGKIEEETGKLRLHLLLRDPENTDIADAYLHPDGRNHIPTYIFFNQAGEELGVFIERPDEITPLIAHWVKEFYAQNAALVEWQGKPLGELPTEVRTPLLAYIKAQRATIIPQEQKAVLEVIKPIVGKVALAVV